MLQKVFGGCKLYALLPLRVALGWCFIAHGGQKLFGIWGGSGLEGFAMYMSQMGLKPPMLFALLAAAAEFFGGLMVLLGVYARWGALAIIGVMVVAIVLVHGSNGFFLMNKGYEYNMVLIGMSLVILLGGSGPYSLKQD